MRISDRLNRTAFYQIILLMIFFFALFLRVFRLTEVPDALHIDEIALGYNAWCIAHHGVDRYLNIMPVYFQNFDGGQSPLYTYCVALLLAAFGKGGIPVLLVRIPGVISSMAAVIFGTGSVAQIFRSRKLTLISAVLLAVCPYFLMHGRFALDCNLMLGCSTFALYQLIRYLQSGKLSRLIVCGISFGFVLYSYALSYSVIALFLCLSALYLLYTKKLTIPRIAIWAAAVCITALPVLLFIASLLLDLPPMRFLGFTVAPVASQRTDDFQTADFLTNVWLNLKLSLTFGHLPMDAVDKYYTMYPVSIPFIVLGFFISVRQFIVSVIKKTFHYSAVYLLFYLCGMITAGLVGGYRIYRINYLFISYLYFLILGIRAVYSLLSSYRRAFAGLVFSCYLLWGLAFIRYYYTMYTVLDFTPHTDTLYYTSAEDAVSFAESELQAQEIYCDFGGRGVLHHFSSPVSPYQWAEIGSPDDESWQNQYYTVDSSTPVSPGNAYIIRKENSDFLNRLYQSGLTYDIREYENYCVFYFPENAANGFRPQPAGIPQGFASPDFESRARESEPQRLPEGKTPPM